MSTETEEAYLQTIHAFIDTYCELIKINRRIGLWDMEAQVHSLLPLEETDKAVLYRLEILGRQGNETRSKCKNRLEDTFSEIVVLGKQIASNPRSSN